MAGAEDYYGPGYDHTLGTGDGKLKKILYNASLTYQIIKFMLVIIL